MQLKSWQFDHSLSNGSLSDQVTTINIVLNVNLTCKIDAFLCKIIRYNFFFLDLR